MNIFGLISKRQHDAEIAALKQQIEKFPDFILATAGAEKYSLPDVSLYEGQARLYQKLSWIAQVIDILASTVPVVEFNVARLVAGKEPRDIPNHPFIQLLAHPNPLDSRFEFLSGTAAGFRLHGNAYWWMNRKDEFTPPDELWNIPANQIMPIADGKLFIKGYVYYPPDGSELFLEPWEVIQFKRYNPFSRLIGLSIMESLAIQAASGAGMIGWNAKFWNEGNGRLPGILMFEQMVEDNTWNKIKADTREASKKRELLMLRGTGGGGVKWLANSVTAKEMEFIQGLQMTKQEIMDTLAPGLHAWLSGESTYSNAGAARAGYNELTLYPMLVLISEKITNQILPIYPGRPLIGYFDDVRIADKQMLLAEQQQYSITHTINAINERYYQGDEMFDDERGELIPSQLQPTSGVEPEPAADTTPPMPYGQTLAQTPMDEGNAPPEDTTDTALQADLARYERKALKRIGLAVEFTSAVIPPAVLRNVGLKLLTCENEMAVKAVFSWAREQMHPQNALVTIAGAIDRYVDAMERNATH